jgi:pyruvate formate lyase activating enzyme
MQMRSEEVGALCEWVATRLGPDVPLHFTAFHPDWKLQDVPPTPLSTLKRAREIALRAGLRYVYTGNVRDEVGQSTYCHACAARLIGRDWYTITAWDLGHGGRCAACGETCPGLFERAARELGSKARARGYRGGVTEYSFRRLSQAQLYRDELLALECVTQASS